MVDYTQKFSRRNSDLPEERPENTSPSIAEGVKSERGVAAPMFENTKEEVCNG